VRSGLGNKHPKNKKGQSSAAQKSWPVQCWVNTGSGTGWRNTAHPVDRTANWCTGGCWFTLALLRHPATTLKTKRPGFQAKLNPLDNSRGCDTNCYQKGPWNLVFSISSSTTVIISSLFIWEPSMAFRLWSHIGLQHLWW
jgi:hypothetical protein